MPWRRHISPIGFEKRPYNFGPSTEPFGTPNVRWHFFDIVDPITTRWCLSVKYDLIHSRAQPVMPYANDRRSRRTLWSMTSNAAERSKSTYTTDECLSKAAFISWCTLAHAVSVEWRGLYAEWSGSHNELESKWTSSLLSTTFSRVFEIKGKLDTGLYFFVNLIVFCSILHTFWCVTSKFLRWYPFPFWTLHVSIFSTWEIKRKVHRKKESVEHWIFG